MIELKSNLCRRNEEVSITKVKVIKRYNDVVLNKIKEKDEAFEVSKERAEHLVKEGMVEIIKEGKETQK